MRGEIAGRFALRHIIDSGPGDVRHAAQDRLTGQRVMLRRLPRAAAGELGRLRQQARAAMRLHHPNIAEIIDLGEDAEGAWVATELPEGETLAAILNRGILAPDRMLGAMMQILDALAYAHAMGVVHRDLQPQVVFIDAHATVRIDGFGLPPSMASGEAAASTWQPPEAQRGERLDHRADIWAAGMLMARMLSVPEPGARRKSWIKRHRGAAEQGIADIVAKATAEFPEDRFASASEFASALRAVTGLGHPDPVVVAVPAARPARGADLWGEEDRPVRPPLSSPAKPRRSRSWLYVGTIAGLMLGLAALAATGLVDGALAPGLWSPASTAQREEEAPRPNVEAASVPTSEAVRVDMADAARMIASAVPCGLISTSVADGTLLVGGLIRRADEPRLQDSIRASRIPAQDVRVAVDSFDAPFCPVIDALRPYAADAEAGPRVTILSPNPLPVGRELRFSVQAPSGWPSVHVAISYLTVEGFIGHIVGAEMAPGTSVTFADPTWRAAEPVGTDVIVVIASDRPIFSRAQRPRVERVAEFAPRLEAALAEARQAGAHVGARAVALRIAPR